MKTCTKCGEEKPLDAFGKHAAGLNGKRSVCKPCNSRAAVEYNKANRLQSAAYHRARNARVRADTISALGGKCAVCGETDHRILQIDHVNNDGGAERKKRINGAKFLAKVKSEANTGRYQVLCCNHNWIKHLDALATGAYG